MQTREEILGKTPDELKKLVTEWGMPPFTAKQILKWIYQKRTYTFDGMTDISKANREKLRAVASIGTIPPAETITSSDGTEKYLFRLYDNQTIEAVYIPDKERATLCISSQVGCRMNCLFCMTGKQGLQRNLTAAEIINQVLSVPHSAELTNIVYMGMGEPTDNLDEVLKSMEPLTAPWGLSWSPKRITLSTVGTRKGLQRYLNESKCHLAVSLHSPDSRRSSLIPADKSFSATDIIDLLRQYDFSHQRRLSFEYIMFAGVNDSAADAEALAHLLKGLDCRVNLIRYHAIPGVPLVSTNEKNMTAFRDALNKKGITATIRASRGEDIFAACGMLSSQHKKQTTEQGRAEEPEAENLPGEDN